MESVQLSNKNGVPISNVGELREILEPFIDTCEINAVQVFYHPLTCEPRGPAKLEIRVVNKDWCKHEDVAP